MLKGRNTNSGGKYKIVYTDVDLKDRHTPKINLKSQYY